MSLPLQAPEYRPPSFSFFLFMSPSNANVWVGLEELADSG